MAIDDRARVALSIAFTASIVAYPDLPPDIPPRVGVGGAFVGAPFVAFLLPVAAAAIWWIVASLGRRPPHAAPRSKTGAVAALFLSAFHLTTLGALITGQLWVGRILGGMIGVGLIATGTVITIGAGRRFSRRTSAAVSILVMCGGGIASAAQAQEMTPVKIAGLPAFLDATVPRLMEQGHVPGAAVAVVYNGRMVLLRGYGLARLDSAARVDPARTLFRIGSVSKVFAAVAALQLVDAGQLDLQRDIREYVPDIPLRYGATTHQLLTHTTGLLERFAGAYTDSPAQLQPLSDHLRRFTPAQARRPGQAYSYSTYNTALTGLVVEKLSGVTYTDYVADRIVRALKMTGTTAHQPPEPNLTADLARGYRWADGRYQPIPYSYTQAGPGGGISATAADMGRFMLMLLGDGSIDGERILSPESVKAMLAEQYEADRRIPARAYEMTHWAAHGQHLLHKDGTLGDQIAAMLLAPADRFGIFVASNASHDGAAIGNQLLEPLLTYLVGPAVPTPPPVPFPEARQRAPRFAGSYRSYSRTRDEMTQVRALMPMLQSRVTDDSDGAIGWQGRRWMEVERLVFRSLDGSDYIVFRENDRGEIVELDAWGASYERVGWWEQTSFHMSVLVTCVIAFLAYPLSGGIRASRRRRSPSEGPAARGCALAVALINLAFVAGLGASVRDLGAITPLPLPMILLLSLPLASMAITALLPALAARAWRDNWWTRGERLGYSTFVVFAVTFMTFLNYWKLLGIRY